MQLTTTPQGSPAGSTLLPHSVLSWVMSVDCGALSIAPCSSFGCRAMFQRWLFVSLWSGLNVFRKPFASCSFSFPHSAMPWEMFPERIPQPCSGRGAPCQLGSQASMLFEMFPSCQLRFSTSICASHLVGLSDVPKARFQPWLSSHALAMSLRVKLDHSSSMSPEARECANQLSPWFLTSFCDSSFNDQFWTDFRCCWPLRFPTWGPTLLSFPGSGVLLPRLCPSCCCPPLQPVSNSATWVDLGISLLWCFPVGFQHDFAHFSDQRISMSGHVPVLLRRFLALCLTRMCLKPCSNFGFLGMFQQWHFESIWISVLHVFRGVWVCKPGSSPDSSRHFATQASMASLTDLRCY